MTTNTWPLPWHIAAALARESGLDWARWAYGLTSACNCVPYQRDDQEHHEVHCRGPERLREMKAMYGPRLGEDIWKREAVPVPDPSDAEAYRADCARRGVEPGPMPALSFDDGRVAWKVYMGRTEIHVWICVGISAMNRWSHWPAGEWAPTNDGPSSLADMARCVALATAAARAMGVGS